MHELPHTKGLPVSSLTGPIKCEYRIQNTDNDWIECKAPFRMAVVRADRTATNDGVVRLHYTVNHDQSISKRRILIDGIGRYIN